MSILLSSFSKEELLDYNLTQYPLKTLFKVPLGEEGFREIDVTLIIKALISWLGLLGQPPNSMVLHFGSLHQRSSRYELLTRRSSGCARSSNAGSGSLPKKSSPKVPLVATFNNPSNPTKLNAPVPTTVGRARGMIYSPLLKKYMVIRS